MLSIFKRGYGDSLISCVDIHLILFSDVWKLFFLLLFWSSFSYDLFPLHDPFIAFKLIQNSLILHAFHSFLQSSFYYR